MNILCRLGLHDFPKRSEIDERFEWVVCRRHCCTEKDLLTGRVKRIGLGQG